MSEQNVKVEVIEIAGTPVVQLTEKGQILTADVKAAAALSVQKLNEQKNPTYLLVNLADVTSFENLFHMVIESQPLVNTPNFRGGIAILPARFSTASSYINIASQVLARNIRVVKTYEEAINYLTRKLMSEKGESNQAK